MYSAVVHQKAHICYTGHNGKEQESERMIERRYVLRYLDTAQFSK